MQGPESRNTVLKKVLSICPGFYITTCKVYKYIRLTVLAVGAGLEFVWFNHKKLQCLIFF
jgi:hypothetical protein